MRDRATDPAPSGGVTSSTGGQAPSSGTGTHAAAGTASERSRVRGSDRDQPSRRRVLTVAALLPLLGIALGWLAYAVLPERYVSRTEVLVLPTSVGADLTRVGQEVQIETEAELARSAQVAALAADDLGGRLTQQQLLRGSEVTIPTNSQVLEIGFSASTPETARDASETLATAYLERRAAEAGSRTETAVAALETQVADVERRLEDLAQSPGAEADPGTAARADADAQRSLLLDQLSDINSRLVPLRAVGTAGGQIISEATLPGSPAFPSLLISLAVGAAIGVLGAAALLTRGDRRPERDVAAGPVHSSPLPVLATVRAGDLANASGRAVLPAADHVLDRVLAHPAEDGPLVLVAVGDDDLAERFAVALLRAWSRRGGSGALVLTLPPIASAHASSRVAGAGVAEVLRREATLDDAIAEVPGTDLMWLGPGHDLGGALSATDVTRLWAALAERHEHTVALAGDPRRNDEALVIARTAGRILVVVAEDNAEDYADAVEELDWWGLGDRVLGAVTVGAGRDRRATPRTSRPVPADAIRSEPQRAPAGPSVDPGAAR